MTVAHGQDTRPPPWNHPLVSQHLGYLGQFQRLAKNQSTTTSNNIYGKGRPNPHPQPPNRAAAHSLGYLAKAAASQVSPRSAAFTAYCSASCTPLLLLPIDATPIHQYTCIHCSLRHKFRAYSLVVQFECTPSLLHLAVTYAAALRVISRSKHILTPPPS